MAKYPAVAFGGAFRLYLCPLSRYRGKGPTVHGMSRERTIWIDPRTKDLAGTLVHELYHIQNPSWTEEVVLRAEEDWGQFAPWQEKAKAVQLLASAKMAGKGEYP